LTADSVPQAQQLSRELIKYFGEPHKATWKRVLPLSQVVASKRNRKTDDDLTLFKSLGMGISDLALGIELYRKALESGLGRKLEAPFKVSPRLKAS
jgi:ornithine cyclodeaminase